MNLQENDTDIYTFFKQKIQKIIKIGKSISHYLILDENEKDFNEF